MTMQQRVSEGLRVLDANDPNWFRAINLDTLDMASMRMCVLGQTFGFYSDGMAELFGPYSFERGEDYGFEITKDENDDFDGGSNPYDALQSYWIPEIAARQEGAAE